MMKAILFTTTILSAISLSAFAQESSVLAPNVAALPEEPAAVTVEQKVEAQKDLAHSIDFKARNYSPEELREIVKATNFLNRRKVETKNLTAAEDEKAELPMAEKVNIKSPKDTKAFLNKSYANQTDEADTAVDANLQEAYEDIELTPPESTNK